MGVPFGDEARSGSDWERAISYTVEDEFLVG